VNSKYYISCTGKICINEPAWLATYFDRPPALFQIEGVISDKHFKHKRVKSDITGGNVTPPK
jgi:hypothetical protein